MSPEDWGVEVKVMDNSEVELENRTIRAGQNRRSRSASRATTRRRASQDTRTSRGTARYVKGKK